MSLHPASPERRAQVRAKAGKGKAKAGKRKPLVQSLTSAHDRLQDRMTNLQVRIAVGLQRAGLSMRPGMGEGDADANVDHLARVCAGALATAREQAAEIERLKAAIDVDIDATIAEAIHSTQQHPYSYGAPMHVLVVQQRNGRVIADACVAAGGMVLPYRTGRPAETFAEALCSLAHDFEPGTDVSGMCSGLQALANGGAS